MRAFILGSGSWATAMAWVLAEKGIETVLWCRRKERADEVATGRHSYLPELRLSNLVRPVTGSDPAALTSLGAFDLAISAVPTQHLRAAIRMLSPGIPRHIPWVSLSKGVEIGTMALPSHILRAEGIADEAAVLSGPSHAEEVVRGVPTAVVLAHSDRGLGRQLQATLSGETFRVYFSPDPVGVEWGGALKNIIAIAAGVATGLGFGDNSLAALVTRGAVEIARLGVALGGRHDTFMGLSGIGDLIVTCFSSHSRNRRFGMRIAKGEKSEEILAGTEQVVEGVPTTRAVAELVRSLGIEMPIAEEMDLVLRGTRGVREGVNALLARSLKEE